MHFVAESLAPIEDGSCVDVEEVNRMRILNLDAQCYDEESESDENEFDSRKDEG